MDSILDKKVGSMIQQGTIVDVKVERVPDKDGVELDKLILDVDANVSIKFRVDEAWVRDRKGSLVSHGLWVRFDASGNILGVSTIGKVMDFYKASTVRDLIGKEVQLHPKKNGYLAVIAVEDFDENEV